MANLDGATFIARLKADRIKPGSYIGMRSIGISGKTGTISKIPNKGIRRSGDIAGEIGRQAIGHRGKIHNGQSAIHIYRLTKMIAAAIAGNGQAHLINTDITIGMFRVRPEAVVPSPKFQNQVAVPPEL